MTEEVAYYDYKVGDEIMICGVRFIVESVVMKLNENPVVKLVTPMEVSSVKAEALYADAIQQMKRFAGND